MKLQHLPAMLLGSMLYAAAYTQPAIKHQKTIGGNGEDDLTIMSLTKDGGAIAGGYSFSNISFDKTENSRGHADYWIVKLDNVGNIQWDKTIGGNSADLLFALQQTSDGGYILGGSSSSDSSGEKTEHHRNRFLDGTTDYWIVKLDSLGNIQWDKTIGGRSDDYLYSLQQTSDGGYIIGGSSYSDKSFEKTENGRGTDRSTDDYWVVKLDSLGNIQWDKTIGGNSYDDLSSIEQTRDGGYILGGTSSSDKSGEKTENTRGSLEPEDYWVVKLDDKGNVEWDKTIGGGDYDFLRSLQQTTDGGCILGGYSYSNISFEKTEDSRGQVDYWVVKLGSLGNIQWDKTIGGNSADLLFALQQTSDGGYILGGNSESNISGEKTEDHRGSFDYWVVKLNDSGEFQWDKTIGGVSYDNLSSVKEIENNHYIIAGSSKSKISGDKTLPKKGDYDYWLVELKYTKQDSTAFTTLPNTNSIKVLENSSNKQFAVYPNPAKDILHIQTNGKATLSLTNQSGKVLLIKTINNKGDINIANLAAGLYYLKNDATGVVVKVVKTK